MHGLGPQHIYIHAGVLIFKYPGQLYNCNVVNIEKESVGEIEEKLKQQENELHPLRKIVLLKDFSPLQVYFSYR